MLNRRNFLKSLTGTPLALSLAPSMPLLVARCAGQITPTAPHPDRVLVAIQLTGGNDGLNTVVPFADDAYARSRPTLRLTESEVLRIDSGLGLHPRMPGFERLFKDGHLAILQGVGCPGLSRDHNLALQAWQTAAPDNTTLQTGWLGRTTDALWSHVRPAPPSVFVGHIAQPLGIRAAANVVPSLQSLAELAATDAPRASTAAQSSPQASPSQLLRHIAASAEQARCNAARLDQLRQSLPPTSSYPDCGLAADLQLVAQLIRAEMGIRIFYVELGGGGIGGFDNHANQLGNHCALLDQLSASVSAFLADLDGAGLLGQVLVLTFSEFGRTVSENGRRGTDHGAAGPMFLAGGAVRGGIHGAHPSLTDLDGGALKHHTDFRSVYATALEQWLGIPSAEILEGSFPRLEVLLG